MNDGNLSKNISNMSADNALLFTVVDMDICGTQRQRKEIQKTG